MLLLREVVRVEESANRSPTWDEGGGLAKDESDDFEENDTDVDSLRLEAGEKVSCLLCVFVRYDTVHTRRSLR